MRDERESGYDDIINLPHHVSSRHPQMSPLDRAAQFSPFAALTGHEAAIRETERLTEEFAELDEDKRELLDEQIRRIQARISSRPEVEVIYFQPDEKKSGGAYVTIRGKVKRIDVIARRISFMDGREIPMEYICAIEECHSDNSIVE
ncbi:MAG: YolD-like family protein [Butyrivibrio sp.]|nr:YolD-like family protein [Muribaculum sp.]MCM1552195.1 YolD-like family protein [Butyrivibrio sp.]